MAASNGKLAQKAVLRTFSPAEAAKYLEKNDEREFQRNISQSMVNVMADAMRSDRWVVNGETVIIDTEGRVIDGQHRLWACIESGKNFTTWVIEGVAPETFQTIDTGRARSGKDMVSIITKHDGMPKISTAAQSAVAAAVRVLFATKNGRYADSHQSRMAFSNATLTEWVESHREILNDAGELAAMGKWCIPLSMAIVIRYLTKRKFADSLREFWIPLQSGVGIMSKESPVAVLRTKATRSPHPADFHATRDIFAQVIKAWNAYGTGRSVKVLKYLAGFEPFPTICLEPGVEPMHVFDTRVGAKQKPEVTEKRLRRQKAAV